MFLRTEVVGQRDIHSDPFYVIDTLWDHFFFLKKGEKSNQVEFNQGKVL